VVFTKRGVASWQLQGAEGWTEQHLLPLGSAPAFSNIIEANTVISKLRANTVSKTGIPSRAALVMESGVLYEGNTYEYSMMQ
jgi:hypothetical protein